MGGNVKTGIVLVLAVWIPLIASHTDWLLGNGIRYGWAVFMSGVAVAGGVLAYLLLAAGRSAVPSSRTIVPLVGMILYGLAFAFIGLHDVIQSPAR